MGIYAVHSGKLKNIVGQKIVSGGTLLPIAKRSQFKYNGSTYSVGVKWQCEDQAGNKSETLPDSITSARYNVLRGGDIQWTAGTLGAAGELHVSSLGRITGGNIIAQTSDSTAYICIASGGKATSVAISHGGCMQTKQDGLAIRPQVYSSGSLVISEGGRTLKPRIKTGGVLSVLSGGSAENVMSYAQATIVQQDGAYVSCIDPVRNQRGVFRFSGNPVVSSGWQFSTPLGSHEKYIVYSDGILTNVSSVGVYQYQSIVISSFGTAISPGIVNSGQLSVCSGGTAIGPILTAGMCTVSSGGTVENMSLVAKGIIRTTVPGAFIQGSGWYGSFYISENVASNFYALLSGSLAVKTSGTAINNTISSGGAIIVSSGGTASQTLINSAGSLVVDGGIATGVTISTGNLLISNSGYAQDVVVNSGGGIRVMSGVISGPIISSGNMTIQLKGTALYPMLSNGKTLVQSTGVISGASLNIGKLSSLTSLVVSQAGTIVSTTIDYGGQTYICQDGMATSTIVNRAGYICISSGGTAISTTVNAEGSCYVLAGGTAISITINMSGRCSIGSAVILSNAVLAGGTCVIFSGGTAISTTLDSYGKLDVVSGGTAISITINSGGSGSVQRATAISITINSGGRFDVFSGSVISTTVNSQGQMRICTMGVASSVVIHQCGMLSVISGGTATNITQNQSGYINLTFPGAYVDGSGYYGSFHAQGNVASNFIFGSGRTSICGGGTVISVTITSPGSCAVFGTVIQPIIKAGGTLHVYSSGAALLVTSETGAVLSAEEGCSITYK